MGQFDDFLNGMTEVTDQDYSTRRKFHDDQLKDFKEALKKGRLVFACLSFVSVHHKMKLNLIYITDLFLFTVPFTA